MNNKFSKLDRCLLCGGEPYVRGAFIPDDPKEWRADEGKGRVFIYTLCFDCWNRENQKETVEKTIFSEVNHTPYGHA